MWYITGMSIFSKLKNLFKLEVKPVAAVPDVPNEANKLVGEPKRVIPDGPMQLVELDGDGQIAAIHTRATGPDLEAIRKQYTGRN